MDYFRGRKLDENLLKKLKITLRSINAVVDEAERKQDRSSGVNEWLNDVKDAVFDAEDLLDEIHIQVSQCKLSGAESQTGTIIGKIWVFFKPSSSSFDREIESRMQQILNNLELLASEKHSLGLKESPTSFGTGSQLLQRYPPSFYSFDPDMYGRDDEKQSIFDWLISDTEMLSMMALVGMGGIGKTTLAQHLYNDPRIEGIFDIKAWVYVSEEFNVCGVLRSILAAIGGSTKDTADITTLYAKLQEKLVRKNFLIVLDDVWNDNIMDWKTLLAPLNYGAHGCKLITTTRNSEVASVMPSSKMFQLDPLGEEHSWALFVKHAFHYGDNDTHRKPEFEEIGKKIVKKCQGLPLALTAIGCLLNTKSSLEEWEGILADEIWNLPRVNIIPALMLSYHHLPPHLKRCFAYCSLFPKGHLFEKQHLILLWIAENFVQCPRQRSSMIKAGEQYFNDLLFRSFFRPSDTIENHFVMHDLLTDLAKFIYQDFCFTLKVGGAQNVSKMTRHFSFPYDELVSSKVFETLCSANKLRTYLPLSGTSYQHQWLLRLTSSTLTPDELFSKFTFLRVFSMAGYLDVVEVPDTIKNLKHLRYLDLSRTGIRKLPDSVCFLHNLQTLKLRDCQYLEELPINLHKLTNLLFLDFHGTLVREMPTDIGKLRNLEVLSSFYVNKDSGSNIQQLGELNLLGKLSISELQNILNPSDALSANLRSKMHLVRLELMWNASSDDSPIEMEVLGMLQPSERLKKLSIRSYNGTLFPRWFGDNSLSNVVSLKLRNCKKCIILPSLGNLPSLKHLQIIGFSGIVEIGSEFYGSTSSSSSISFPSLESLTFDDMKEWQEWDCEMFSSAFPHLQKLSMRNCPSLKGHLPKKLACLLYLEICNCEQLVASIPLSPTIHALRLINCGKLQINYDPTTLKFLTICRCCMDESFNKWVGHTSRESLKVEWVGHTNNPGIQL